MMPLVQAEFKLNSDKSKYSTVSSTMNISLKGMPLQFNSTVHFVEQKCGTVTITHQECASNSPYGTDEFAGLPPRSINKPDGCGYQDSFTAGEWLVAVFRHGQPRHR